MSKQKTIKKRNLKPEFSEAVVIYDGIKTLSAVGLRGGAIKLDTHVKHIQDSPTDKAQIYSNVLSYIVNSKDEEMDDMIKSVSRFAK